MAEDSGPSSSGPTSTGSTTRAAWCCLPRSAPSSARAASSPSSTAASACGRTKASSRSPTCSRTPSRTPRPTRTKAEALDTMRRFVGDAVEITPDQQGRIVINATLREYAGLGSEVVITGLIRRAEIWDRDAWLAKSRARQRRRQSHGAPARPDRPPRPPLNATPIHHRRREERDDNRRRARGVAPLQPPGQHDGRPLLRPLPIESVPGRHPGGHQLSGGLQVSDTGTRRARGFRHEPVLLERIVELFAPVPPGWVVDATVGGAGHASAILEHHPHLKVLGLDQDADALAAAAERLAALRGPRALQHVRFDALEHTVQQLGTTPVSGVLFDLGVSSPQLDRAERGFSYRHDAPLDMRMDQGQLRSRRRHRQRHRRARARRHPPHVRRRALRPPHRQGHRRRPPGRHHRRAGRDRARRHPRPRSPHRRPPRQAHVPGDPHRGQRRARHPPRRHRQRHRRARPRRALRGAVVPLGRGPHREGPPPPRRHRRLDGALAPASAQRRPSHGPAPQGRLVDAVAGGVHRQPVAPRAPASGPPRSSIPRHHSGRSPR